MRARAAHALLRTGAIAGLVLRLAALPLPGTLDVSLWKIWAFAAATDGPAGVYGTAGRSERRALKFDGKYATVDYPPGTPYALAVVGTLYSWWDPAFRNGPALTAAVKVPCVVADGVMAWLLLVVGRRWGRAGAGTAAALAWWLNPAVLLDGAVLGYLDPWFVAPACGALVAAAGGNAGVAGLLVAVAVLFKAQAVLIVPVLFLALVHTAGLRGLGRALFAAASIVAVAIVPVLVRGGGPAFAEAMASLSRHDLLSGNAANVWWLVTWVFRAGYEAGLSWGAALLEPVQILAVSTVVDLGHPNLRPVGTLMAVGAACWILWKARGVDDLWRWAAAASLVVHAYFMLAVAVHENHLYLALPLACIAAVGRSAYVRVAAALSAVSAANLYVFYGLGEGMPGALPRDLLGVDASVAVALAGVAVFAWHVRTFLRTVESSV